MQMGFWGGWGVGKGRQPGKIELFDQEAREGDYRLSPGETLGATTGHVPESTPPAGQGAGVFIHALPSTIAGG